ncbi:MAG: hypothetical protein PWP65_576 [Clostridia bacterium]|nr:hypothetical protein [Clostridia bacterium]
MQIFQRQLKTIVETGDPGHIIVKAHMYDTYHEMEITLTIETCSRVIKAAWGRVLRSPYDLCPKTEARLQNLIGAKVAKGVHRIVAAGVGGSEGCTHFYELVMDSLRAAVQALNHLEWANIPPGEERRAFLRRAMAGECYVYSHPELEPRLLVEE